MLQRRSFPCQVTLQMSGDPSALNLVIKAATLVIAAGDRCLKMGYTLNYYFLREHHCISLLTNRFRGTNHFQTKPVLSKFSAD